MDADKFVGSEFGRA